MELWKGKVNDITVAMGMISIEYCYSRLEIARLIHLAACQLEIVVQWLQLFFRLPAYSNDKSSTPSVTAQTVREGLHVATYGEITTMAMTTCAVCLSEVQGKDKVWELRNCRHVFHEGCLDRWMDHDERVSCPLCRAPLMTQAQAEGNEFMASSQPSWAVERLLYLFGDDLLLN